MASHETSTNEHQGPIAPEGGRKRPAFVVAFPKPTALALPDSGTVIGRKWLSERGISDTEVSTSHLKIDRAGGVVHVSDIGSRNGTWVNGARLSPRDRCPLSDGAIVRMGRTLFVFREALQGPLEPSGPTFGLVGPYGLRRVTDTLNALGNSRASNVLIEGETGVGKELVARAVAKVLGRETPFAAVNVAGVAKALFESQIFGHVQGAFSDAKTASPGIVVAHDRGTVFLDEIGELALDLQVKLLRLLENREVLAVGAQKPFRVDVAFVAATNRDLEEMVEQGTFRRDLFARLAMGRIWIPPLRDRPEDLYAVAAALTERAGGTLATSDVEVEAMERLLLEPWPANVRDLDAVLAAARRHDPAPGLRLWSLTEVLGAAEGVKSALTEETVEQALSAHGGNATAAAAALGVSRGKLMRFRKQARSAK